MATTTTLNWDELIDLLQAIMEYNEKDLLGVGIKLGANYLTKKQTENLKLELWHSSDGIAVPDFETKKTLSMFLNKSQIVPQMEG